MEEAQMKKTYKLDDQFRAGSRFQKFAFGMLAASAAIGWAGASLADSFTLRVGAGHPDGATAYVSEMADFFVPEVKKRVAERTDHTVNFVEAYGGTVAGLTETLEFVESGLLDIGVICFCFEPSKLFLHNFPYYAPFGPGDAVQEMRAVRAVYDANPWLTEVFETDYNQKLLALHGWDTYHLGTTFEWDSVDDLKGIKIGGAGPNLPWLEFSGAVPVQSELRDGYMSMKTGVYEGWLMFPSSYLGFKLYEPAKYYTLVGFGAMGVNGVTMNLDALKRLPEEVQEIISEVSKEYEERAGTVLNKRQAEGINGLKEGGAVVNELDPQVQKDWARAMAEFPKRQADDANGRGMPGTAVMTSYIQAVRDSGFEWPYEYEVE
ncbi:C4-dicarboxylate TRAP transporter substrate-binding protein [Nitratireductor kimnyeongensis]|uniref:C4-dicarboxylate TRAP transporter substrate-binding protein n=1 Tax=Nitratireductor kimnyeongensis TaxID=430679 RepID=A0ABW0T865_9HYPH|nr:C4-dicarboxylate TRAP transporter substrate-binding protein [Nitratireductor kimnyeongensis]QZZ34390.1 C4-dicarboxylate TRAP transporter substrate-binding protein [Nitratireductor kimnyeongensis]